MKAQLFKFLRRINPKFKRDAAALYNFLQKQNDYTATRKTPFKYDWDYWDELIKYLNSCYGVFIDDHFKHGLLLVSDNGKIRSLDIADKTRTSLLDQLDIMRIMLDDDEKLIKKYSDTKLKKQIERACQEDRKYFLSKYEIWQGFNDLISRGGIKS